MSTWEGHRDLCELQWQDTCTCRCSSIACPGVFACRAVQCQDLWPDREPFVVPTGEQVLRDPYDLDDDERRGY
jgi:hypothetical protein